MSYGVKRKKAWVESAGLGLDNLETVKRREAMRGREHLASLDR